MSVIQRRLHLRPIRDILHEFVLVRQRQQVHVRRDIYMQNVKFILLAQIVRDTDEARRSSLRHAVVNNDQFILDLPRLARRDRLAPRNDRFCKITKIQFRLIATPKTYRVL